MADYSLADLRAALDSIPPMPDCLGRGIVIAGGGRYLASAYVAVRSVRHTGCDLPIQMWHLGPEEMPDEARGAFEEQGAELVDALAIEKSHPFRKLNGWKTKIFSILYSRFMEVLFLDADNFALKDPSFLFEDPAYKGSGCIFWPDLVFEPGSKFEIKPFAWSFLGLPALEDAELESGQILIDKGLCWEALWLTRHMNENSDFYYEKCTYGDKDTFRLAWTYLNKPINVIHYRPSPLPNSIAIQHAPDGSQLFQHARKWELPLHRNGFVRGYQMEDEALEWLREFLNLDR
ncbi:MAG TPA: hypothetical protein VGL56_17040 [Fimbriimonadaceae bacterium]|jgi:hypothetical protein